MSSIVRWGILGTGNIAHQFGIGLRAAQRGRLVSVGSRSVELARAFRAEFGAKNAFGSYEAVLADPDVDAVYISLPNSMHHEWTIRALKAGKHVLCEKPLASNAAEAEEMFDAARAAGRILIEAFMYRVQPLMLEVMQRVREGIIGQVRLVRSSFCYRTMRIADNIRFKPELAGGSLMDIGCYCIDFSRLAVGEDPAEYFASGHLHETDVDDAAAGVLRFPGGALASFACGMSVQADNAAMICGTDGYIQIPVPWKPPVRQAAYIVARSTPPRMDAGPVGPSPSSPQTFFVDAGADLYAVEVDHVAGTILDAAPPLITEADSLANMRILDGMRQQIGMKV